MCIPLILGVGLRLLGSLAALAPAERPLNLLLFGNSYSQGGLQWRVQDLAVAGRHAQPVVLVESLGGSDLPYHLSQVKTNPPTNVTNALIGTNTGTASSSNINAAEGADSPTVAPVGQGFGLLSFDSFLYNPADLHHPSVAGNLLESLIVYRTIYNDTSPISAMPSGRAWTAPGSTRSMPARGICSRRRPMRLVCQSREAFLDCL